MPKISIVIPTYKHKDVIARTLPLLFEQDFPPDDYEVVVAVGASDDGTLELLQSLTPRCGFQVIDQRPNKGQSDARNIGILAARSPLVLEVDDDIVCDSRLVASHMEMHQATPSPACVIGPVLVHADSLPTLATRDMQGWTNDYFADLEQRGGRLRYPEGIWISSNCSMPRDALIKVGLFDVDMHVTHMDADLAIKLWKHGLTFRYQPKAVTYQWYVKGPETLVRKDAEWAGRNDVVLSRRYPEYRRHAMIGTLGGGSATWRVLRKWATNSRISPEPLLRPAYWLAEKFKRSERIANLGVRLLRNRKAIEMLRGARREAGSWKVLDAEFGVRLPVLMYHHVGPAQPGTLPRLTISPDEFRKQVEWLAANGYHGISARAWIEWCEQGTPLPPKPVLFTFDDAYKDIAEYALPILGHHGFSAVVFVVTQRLGATNDWDADVTPTRLPLMTAEQIVEWHRRGIEFGSHTQTHADLTASPELNSEIAGSKSDLQRLLGESPESFAYPYGRQTESVRTVVAENYKLAFGVQQGLNYIKTDPYAMARTMVKPGESLWEFSSRVRTGRNRFEAFLPGLRNRFSLRH